MDIRELTSPAEVQMAYSVMKQLRPHLENEQVFVEQVSRMQQQDYALIAAFENHEIVGLAGYRLQENLMYGKFLYVDDLVVTENARSKGVGSKILKAVIKVAKENNCAEFVLDTGLSMAMAQRFYFSQGLLTQAIRFRNSTENLS